MTKYSLRVALCAALALAVPGFAMLTTGCDEKKDNTQIIGRLLNNPTEFSDKELSVIGKVTNRFDPTNGLLGLAAYQVDDGSGKIWIISRAGAPEIGQELHLKARLRRDPLPVAVTIPGISLTLLDELERGKK